jgi:dephospho-CoA kinase
MELVVEHAGFIKKYGIGLTGGIATGKSTVAEIIRKNGYTVIDADLLAREAVKPKSPGLAELVLAFGAEILHEDGSLNRDKLRNLIATKPETRITLENILHPMINILLSKKIEELGLIQHEQFWFYEAALIFEKNTANRFKEVWVTYCSRDEQLRRLMQRAKCDRKQAELMIKLQFTNKDKAAMADYVIDTETNPNLLEARVVAALERLKTGSGASGAPLILR